jgi:hypothetical protein
MTVKDIVESEFDKEEYEVVVGDEEPQQQVEEEEIPEEKPAEDERVLGILKELEDLKSKLDRPKEDARPQPQPQPQLEDYASFKKKLADKAFTDPIEAMEEYFNRRIQEHIAPAYGQLAQQMSQVALGASKLQAMSDPMNKMVAEKWSREVDEAVKTLPPSVDVYAQACQRVAMNHIGDLVRMKVEEELNKKPEVPPKGAVPDAVAKSPEAKQKKVIRLTEEQMKKAKARGIDPVVYSEFVLGRDK